ncbi:MAG TPA: OmpA family protein [Chryseolinea sp.]|nr:OmpA family protein [Chryseolinea sp.]HPM30909.1 OmpA family protein [Chryseolinea sp.]
MEKHFLGALFIFISLSGFSQGAKDLIDKGDRLYAKKDYIHALEQYLPACETKGDDAMLNLKVGMCYLYSDTKWKASIYLEKAYRLDPKVDLDIDYFMGMAYQNSHQFSKAIVHFENFKKNNKKLAATANDKIQACIIADSLSRKPTRVIIENIGGPINSNFNDYSPLISGDGNTMIFTSNRSTDDYKIKSGTNFEDIYITERKGGNWDEPKKISPNINIKFNDAAASLSADGNTLLLYYEDGGGDIYISTRSEGEWSKPIPLSKNINTPLFWETSACLSPDGKKIFFASNRPGGRGELDLYVSEMDTKGVWGKATNLGTSVNTAGNEDSPFLHADGVTLYFSSDGHPTMGGNDIFKSDFKDGKWEKPTNLGYPINSIEYDGFFTMSADKKTGYYSTLRQDGLGSADVYTVTFLEPLPEEKPVLLVSTAPEIIEPVQKEVVAIVEPLKEEIPPKPDDYVDPIIQFHKDLKIVTVLKGKVIDEISAAPLSATISLVNNETNMVIAKINSDPTTGIFELTIPHGGNYGVATEKSGYLFNSINFNLPQFAEYQEIDTHIIMVKAEVGSKVVLKNVFFNIGKSDLQPESIAEIEKLRELLVANPELNVQINGHTDNTGNAASNKALSLKRASAVVDYLVSKGVSTTRVSAKGFGSERPIVSNDDEEGGRAINRRTEIEIIEAKSK